MPFSLSPLGSRLETVGTSIQEIKEHACEIAWKETRQSNGYQHELDSFTQGIWHLLRLAELHGVQGAIRTFWQRQIEMEPISSIEEGKCILLMTEPWPGTELGETMVVSRSMAEKIVSLGIARCITLEQRKLIDGLREEAKGTRFVLPELDWDEGVFEQPVAETHSAIVVVLEAWPGVKKYEVVRLTEKDAQEVVKNGWARRVTLEQADIIMKNHEDYARPRPRFHVELRNACLVHRGGKRVKAG